MRQIVLDTETTGLEIALGHRLAEIGAIELIDRRPTGRRFHCYLNPERDIDFAAQRVTGLTREFLADKPLFADVVDEFCAFVADAELLMHNAAFDEGFLNDELRRVGRQPLGSISRVTDTLQLARKRFPGQRNSLDALCKRFGVDHSMRGLHGALLDAQLLVEVYLALTSWQCELGLAAEVAAQSPTVEAAGQGAGGIALRRADQAAVAAHVARLAAICEAGTVAIWDLSAKSKPAREA